MESMDVSFNELSSADSPLASQPSVSPRINATKLFTKIVALEGRITSAITCEIAKAFEQFEQRMKIENEKLSEMLKKNENWAASIKKHVMAVEDSINASKNEDNVHVKEDGEIEKGSNEKDKISRIDITLVITLCPIFEIIELTNFVVMIRDITVVEEPIVVTDVVVMDTIMDAIKSNTH
jgi:hypothetical protein